MPEEVILGYRGNDSKALVISKKVKGKFEGLFFYTTKDLAKDISKKYIHTVELQGNILDLDSLTPEDFYFMGSEKPSKVLLGKKRAYNYFQSAFLFPDIKKLIMDNLLKNVDAITYTSPQCKNKGKEICVFNTGICTLKEVEEA